MSLRDYKEAFANLNVHKKGKIIAPHKAIMLLTVMDLIDTEDINSPFVPLSGTLEKRYKSIWDTYVPQDGHYKCNMHYPFFHLSSSNFWEMQKLSTFEESDDYTSMPMLKRSFAGALLHQDLFDILSNEENRAILKEVLIDNYLRSPSDTGLNISGSLLTVALAILCVA